MQKTNNFIFRLFLAIMLLMIAIAFESSVAGMQLALAQGEDESDPADESAEFFIRNPNFEDTVTAPWAKRPKVGPGVFFPEQAKNAIPTNGSWNAALQPNGADITMQQVVLVAAGTGYRLQAWVSSSGVTTQLIWWTKEEGDHICNTVTVTWPNYGPVFCDFTVPVGTTKFRVKLRALSAPAGNWVVTDGWSLTKASDTHAYAGVRKSGNFNGVAATIGTPIPAIREYFFSYSTINILRPCASCAAGWKGVEAGIIRAPYTSCIVKFSYSTSDLNWSGRQIDNPRPVVGHKYRFYIFRVATNRWRLQIWEGQSMIYQHPGDLTVSNNGGFDSGQFLTATGEVDSPNRYNDMGVSSLRNLSWSPDGVFFAPWDGWDINLPVAAPYVRSGITQNQIQVSGNNGNPLPPGSPCGF